MGAKFVADPAIAKANLTEALQTLKDGIAALDTVAGFTRHLSLASRGNLPKYSVNNQILILTARPNATEVGGFHYWLRKKRTPLKGRGVRILAPAIFTKSREVENEETGETETVEQTMRRFRCVTVWDIRDTDGPALPDVPVGGLEFQPAEPDALPFSVGTEAAQWALEVEAKLAEGLRRVYGVTIEDGSRPGVYGCFYPMTNRIEVNRAGHDYVTNASTLAHEGAHCVVHHTPALKGGGYDVEEQIAEGAAFAYFCRHGLRTDRFSFAYIKGYSGNGKAVAALLGRIGKVTALLALAAEGQEAFDSQEVAA